ncbi:filamentous haemagglutinin family protein [Caulobacter soli]|uniref:filamentous haemagglutinin family protein n=1 Tax=Caulobacter soli TaxID=2708539 RepID=UPI0013EE23EB|nr:filamentous haemagglutinin family protein [Caulobacter soli]
MSKLSTSKLSTLRSRRLLLAGASLATLLAAQPAAAQTVSGLRGTTPRAGGAPTAPGVPVTTLPPTAQAALARQTAIKARVATAMDLANQAQAAARAAALAKPSTIPNGLVAGGLVPAGAITTNPSLWLNANAPTQVLGADGKTLVTIDQTAAKAILTWDSFNVGKDTTVHFDQTQGTQADGSNEWIVLNRINDPSLKPSTIQGMIKAEGSVYLINRNGVLFTGTSQVNTHSLIVSALPFLQDLTIDQANQQFLKAGIGDPLFSNSAVLGTMNVFVPVTGDVTIEAGADIETKEGGFALIAGNHVTNSGSIVSNGGQTMLVGGVGVNFTASSGGKLTPTLTGAPASVNGVFPEFAVVNTGSIVALRGDISIVSNAVRQQGLVMATTSITRPGSINITASPLLVGRTIGGSAIFAPGSLTAVLPDANAETTSSAPAADDVFEPGSINVTARGIWFQQDSTLYAPGAKVSLATDAGGSELAGGVNSGRVQVDSGAILSVAGLADVERPMSDNLVTVPRIGQNELADSPLQRDGILYRSPFTVDGRDSGTRDDGLAWVGSPVANVGGYVQGVPRSVNQMLVDGGSLDIAANSIVLVPGGTLDVSGGYTQYLGGSVQTTRLIGADGRIYNAATADPLMTYVGFAGQTSVEHSRWGVTDSFSNSLMNGGAQFESSYVQGGKGGALGLTSVQMILTGALHGDTVIGRYQIGDGKEPQGASLSLKGSGLRLSADGTSYDGVAANETLLTPERLALPTNDIDNILWTANISTRVIDGGGFGSVSLKADMLTVDADAALTVLPGGSIAFTAARMDVLGKLTAHAGAISLTTTGVTGAGGYSAPGNPPAPDADGISGPTVFPVGTTVPLLGDITIGGDAVLDVSGLWINDTGAGRDQQIGDSFVNGGKISLVTNVKVNCLITCGPQNVEGYYDTTGGILLKPGSLLDASGGGYVGQLGRVATKNGVPIGRGGDIGLVTYQNKGVGLFIGPKLGPQGGSGDPITNGRLELDGTLKAYGFAGGGTLTLQALQLQVGGDAADLPDYATYFSQDWFSDQGFGAYKLSAIYDATIADGATVRVSQRNYVADLGALARLATGGAIDSVATLGVLDPYRRQATDFSLTGDSYITWDARPLSGGGSVSPIVPKLTGVAGVVTLGEGAAILADAGADVSLASFGQLNVLGGIVAHGGSVDIEGLNVNGQRYDYGSRSVWLGKDSLIDVSGIALIDPLAKPVRSGEVFKTPVSGVVLDGGSVSIQGGNAFVVAEAGSRIDVSGAKAVLDIRTQSANPFAPIAWTPTEVASDGGSVMLGSTNGLYFDGAIAAHGGSDAARGGTLQIASAPNAAGYSVPPTPTPPVATAIVLQQSGMLVTSDMAMGGAIEGGQISKAMHFAVDRLDGSGIDTLVLGGDPTQIPASDIHGPMSSAPLESIVFSGDVNLSLDRAVMMDAHNYVGTDGATVSIAAPYVALTGGGITDITPVLTGGSGTLNVTARQIDLMGQFTLQRFAEANFTSSGDIRLMMPAELGYFNASKVERPGELITAGDLTFKAAQVYPATGNVFLIAAPTAGSTVTFLGNGSTAPPISAGGALLVDAANIVQDGTIRAPSGTVQLGVGDINDASVKTAFNNLPLIHTSNVTLSEGSVTSVSLDGRSLPYGTTTDGTDWALIVQNSLGTTTKLDPLIQAPSKLIGLAGDNVDFADGATVDLSGGGELYAQEWVPGTGGSRDLLNAVNTTYSSGAAAAKTPLYADGREVYAVVPGYQAPVAAYDPSFGYPGQDQLSSVGKAVYLSGVPGLPDGVYTLLPGQYATLPGAFRVVQQTDVIDSTPHDNVTLADGGQVVSGRFVDALTGKSDARTTSFLVQSQEVWKQYSEYTISSADVFFPGKAAHAESSATRTPVDAGRLVLAAVNSLILDGELKAQAGAKGRGAAVDISAQAIQILGGSGEARDGYLQVDATALSNLGAESLLIGGTRSDGVNGTTITAIASSVVLSNDKTSALTGPEVMLVTKAGGDGLVLESGSVLAAKGDIANPSSAPILIGKDGGATGDGALVRVSNGGAVSVIRDNVPGLDGVAGTATGQLDIRAGASVDGGKSTILDSTGDLLLDPGAAFAGQSVDVNANTVAFVGEGSTAAPTGFVVGEQLLAQLAHITTLGLHSRSSMTFFGDVDLVSGQSLTLGANAFVSDGGDVTITAPKLVLTNDVGGGAAIFAGGTGSLTIKAGELDFGAGAVTVQGFGAVTATATQGVVGQGRGSFDFGDLNVAMTAPVFTADSGANTAIKTTGALTLNRGAGTAITRETLGGALSLSGGSLTTDATIAAGAGNITLAATSGDLTLLNGALASTKGYTKTFFDTEAYGPGGNLTLTASTGAITVNNGATLDFSGADKGGDAGSLTLNASGVVTLDGVLKGGAASADYRGGRLTLASGGAIDLDRIADLSNATGITGALSITSGAGNLVLSAGKALKGQVIYLAANGGDHPGDAEGNVVVNGVIDVSGEAAGHIDLFGKSGVDLSGQLLATSSVAHQDGGVVTLGTTGVTDGSFNGQYGYETVQAADSGAIRIRGGALIDVSGGSADSGGSVSFRAPLLSDGDVKIAIDGGSANIKGAKRVTIEPYAKWSTADATTGAQHFDGIIDPAGWYGADGKLLAGQWTDDKGVVLAAPADEAELKTYLSKYYFMPTTANADHLGFYGYAGGDPANGPGALMGFVQAPGFSFGNRYAGIAGVHVRPGIELANPGETVNGGNVDVLTNWNLGAGETGVTGGVTLAYRYGFEAPVLTVRAERNINLKASITDGFYQQNDGAHLQDPVAPPAPPTGGSDPAYDAALVSYTASKGFLDSNGLWNGSINLVAGGTADISADPNYEPLRAPLTDQSANYYSNYMAYIGEIGQGNGDSLWADIFWLQSVSGGFLNYSPNASPNGDTLKSPADFASYADYQAYYQTWLMTWFDVWQTVPGSGTDTTPIPLQQPIDTDYADYSQNYQQVYIPGHNAYFFYTWGSVGIPGTATQLFYAPFAPRSDAAGSPAYQAALTSYRASKNFLDSNGLWNGSINLLAGGTADISHDPNYEPLRAPLTDQSANYYSNYMAYIGEIGQGNGDSLWADIFWLQSVSGGFLNYSPNASPNGDTLKSPADFASYADYQAYYQTWLMTWFDVWQTVPGSGTDTTPIPLQQPIDTDYADYSQNYQQVYIPGHNAYFFYTWGSVGIPGTATQLFYAPFSPRSDADTSGPGGPGPVVVPIAAPGPNNSPSNMPIAGRPTSLASATLLGGESSSYRLVAGADFGAADALAINRLTGTGSVSLDGHFEVVDSTTTDDNGAALDPRNPAVGKTLVLPNVIRTGVGSIDIAAASDITLSDAVAPGAIYTGGEPVGASSTSTAVDVIRPGLLNVFFSSSPTFLATPAVQPDNGGDITLTAGGSIRGNQQVFDVDGSITGTAGANITQYWYPWLNSGRSTDDATSINFGNFDQGVLSAGGDVSVLAGGDIRELSVSLPTTWYLTGAGPRATQTVNLVGGGDLSVEAGGDILGGSYFIAKGAGRIDAGGDIGSAFTYQASRDTRITSPLSTILAIQDAQVQVTARGDLDIGRFINPGQIGFGQRGLSRPFTNTLDQISAASSLQLTSVTGDVGFDTLNAPLQLLGGYIGGGIGTVDYLLPATLKVTALDGGVTIADGGMLSPSATGQLSLLANDTVRMMTSSVAPLRSFGLAQFKPQNAILNLVSASGVAIDPSALPSQSLATIDGLLHADDAEPVRIYSLTGDVVSGRNYTENQAGQGVQANQVWLQTPKATQIRAGRDIVDLVFLGQNLHDSDVTSIIAGRDIVDLPGQLSTNNPPVYTLYGLAGLIQLAGPGRLDVQAGRDLGPLDRDLADSGESGRILPSTGIQTIGNLYNPYLPRESADISVLFGTGPGVAWNAFAAAYLDPAATGTDLPSFDADLIAAVARYRADMDKRAGGKGVLPSLTADQAWAAFQAMPEAQRDALAQTVFFKILAITGADYNDPNSPFFNKYARGYQAIETLFPSALGYTKNNLEGGVNGAATLVSTGNLDIRGSTIQTQMGGDINIMGPGGQLLIGSTASPPYVPATPNGGGGIGPQSQGILAWETGAVNIFSDRSLLLAQSRIFTERGGDMTIWSSNGDINAGKGSKTSSEIKPVDFICSADFYCRVDAASQVTGAGIAAFAGQLGVTPPTVTLVAPRGTVDAGDAGIRVAGNLIVAAQFVANADNIQVEGATIGVPTNAVDVSGNLDASSAAASAVQEVVQTMQQSRRNTQPSVITVTVDGFGIGPNDCDANADTCPAR